MSQDDMQHATQIDTQHEPPTEPDWRAAIQRAVDIVGGQLKLGRACGVGRNAVYFALNKARTPPIDLALAISRATGGQVKIAELIPSVVDAIAAELSAVTQK